MLRFKLQDGENTLLVGEDDFCENPKRYLRLWKLTAISDEPQTDSEAATMAERQQISMGCGDFLAPTLTIPRGTEKRKAMEMISEWRQSLAFFSRALYRGEWVEC